MNSAVGRRRKSVTGRDGKRKAENGTGSGAGGCLKRVKTDNGSTGVDRGHWCPLSDGELKEVRVKTGMRVQKTRKRSVAFLSAQIQALTRELPKQGTALKTVNDQSATQSHTSTGLNGFHRNGSLVHSAATSGQSRGTDTMPVNPGDPHVRRLRESILNALTEQQKMVLMGFPIEKRRAFIKTYVERRMQREGLSLSSANQIAQDSLASKPGLSAANDLDMQCIAPKGAPGMSQMDPVSNYVNGSNTAMLSGGRTVKKGALSYTEVGKGQYVCSGIPKVVPFSGALDNEAVKAEWPRKNGASPVRTLHSELKQRGIPAPSDNVTYVVPVKSLARKSSTGRTGMGGQFPGGLNGQIIKNRVGQNLRQGVHPGQGLNGQMRAANFGKMGVSNGFLGGAAGAGPSGPYLTPANGMMLNRPNGLMQPNMPPPLGPPSALHTPHPLQANWNPNPLGMPQNGLNLMRNNVPHPNTTIPFSNVLMRTGVYHPSANSLNQNAKGGALLRGPRIKAISGQQRGAPGGGSGNISIVGDQMDSHAAEFLDVLDAGDLSTSLLDSHFC